MKERTQDYTDGRTSAFRQILGLLPGAKSEVWEKFKWEACDVEKLAVTGVLDLLDRLEKARDIYRVQRTIIEAASQLSIDDLINKEG